ncbi:hypothetical protein [Cellulomonas sp.]|uniref:hypothetical protein n=1 Tax=Cellulomonas sp. TaxID=40001 RepID=UPI001B250D0B|nr:hypothetical protein [Cellulomonas sp.]MBO9556509.1 hypothetical protein [Cellulomonas sp.]
MTRDLIDLMHADVAARERSIAGTQPGHGVVAGVVRRVRRKRAVRHTLQSAGALVVVVALGGASWFGLRGHETPEPAHTPTPSVSPTTAPTPSPTSAPAVLDEIPGLPPTQALPPGLLQQTTPGWVLTIYRSEPLNYDTYGQAAPALVHTVVLVFPAGERYRVVDLPVEAAVSILRWDAGDATAVVNVEWMQEGGTGGSPRAVLDLTSGALTPTPVGVGDADGGPFYQGVAADGAELWSDGLGSADEPTDLYRRTDDGAVEQVGKVGYPMHLDPTGRRMVSVVGSSHDRFALLDVVDGGRSELDFGVPGRWCDLVGWADAGSLLATCADPEPDAADYPARPNSTLVRVEVSGGATHATELKRYADDEPDPSSWGGVASSGAYAAFTTVERGVDACAAGIAAWDGGAVVPIQGVTGQSYHLAAVAGLLYVESAPSCQEAVASTLTAYDPGSGTSVVLAPVPAPTADVQGWMAGLTTWAVAGARTPTHF